jgi:hypothetical protein
MGIKTVMITGDNPLTAAAIAPRRRRRLPGPGDAGDQARADPRTPGGGRLVAMTGTDQRRAALAQADVAVAMNSGTQAAKEAGNMVDLDSNPTKLIEIVETGETDADPPWEHSPRSASPMTWRNTSRSFRRRSRPPIPPLVPEHHAPGHANQRDILSAVIFNALIIIALIPLALRGIRYRPIGAAALSAQQPADLRSRRRAVAVPRDQAHRHDSRGLAPGLSGPPYAFRTSSRAVIPDTTQHPDWCHLPAVVTGIAHLAFRRQAEGSLIPETVSRSARR